MKRFISYGSIEQFRKVIKDINFINGTSEILPTLNITGTEKIHGTNAAVCYSNDDGFWVQSRKKIIDQQSDNMGCAVAAYNNKQAWMSIINKLAEIYNVNLKDNVISIYYEWAGGNIQKKSALTGLDKRAIIFRYCKVSPITPKLNESGQEIPDRWVDTCCLDVPEYNIWNISNFPTISIEVDFNQPILSQNQMIKSVEKIEIESLVGKQFGIDNNVGEGYVFSFYFKGGFFTFKVKGDKHTQGLGGVTKLKPVDEKSERKIIDFINNVACVSWRLEQMYDEVIKENNEVTMKLMSVFLGKVITDVTKEESDLIKDNGFDKKIINKKIAQVARNYFISKVK